MRSSVLRSRLAREAWWYPVIAIAPFAVLATLVVFTAIIKHAAGVSLLIDLSLCALAAAWMLWMFTLHPDWHDRPAVMAVFVGVLIAIVAILVVRDSWFGALAIVGYVYVFAVTPWPWQLLGVSAFAILAGAAQASGVPATSPFGLTARLVIIAVNVGAICGFAWIHHDNAAQSDERKRALQEASEANQRLEETLAENAALYQRLVAEARRAGTLDERQRMAREIHDTLAQGLIGIITQLQAAEQAGDDPVRWRDHFGAATALARQSLSEARRSVRALRPEQLEAAQLSDALTEVAERWSALHGTAVSVATTGTVRPLSSEGESALLRTAQEALANVARHANASRVGLTLSYLEDQVALDVRDDGAGFDPASLNERFADAEAGGGFGLVAMRQRIEGLSGTLQIESEPDEGTAISARIPSAIPPASASPPSSPTQHGAIA